MKSATGSYWSTLPLRLVRSPADDVTAAACSRRTITSRTGRSPTLSIDPVTVTIGSLVVVTTSGVTRSMRTCRNGIDPGSPAAAWGAAAGAAISVSSARAASRRASTTRARIRGTGGRPHGPCPQPFVRRDVCSSGRRLRVCECVWARRRGEVCGSGGSDAGPVGMQLVDQLTGDLGEPAFVGVGQPRRQLLERHPRHFADFDVLVGELAAEEPHQIVVHGLVHATTLGDEPVVDAAERRQHTALDAGLLGDLTDRGLFCGFTEFDVALGQRPQHPAAPVDAPDQCGDLTFLGPVDSVDHQPARGGFMHRTQPIGGPARSGLLRLVLAARLVFVGLHRPVLCAARGGVVVVL